MAASSFAPFSISGGSHLKPPELWSTKRNLLSVQRKSNLAVTRKRRSAISAEYRDNSGGGGGGDFLAGFLLGGAVLGTLGYVFAPQIRRSLLNEDEHGFRKARRPIYYDEGLERTRQTLNRKISQLNSAIDDVSSRLRGGNNIPAQVGSDPEVEATMIPPEFPGQENVQVIFLELSGERYNSSDGGPEDDDASESESSRLRLC